MFTWLAALFLVNVVLGDEPTLDSVAKPMAQSQATWQLPASYSETVGPVSVLQVRPDLYMLTVDGANVAVETGDEATVVIGTAGAHCPDLVAAVAKIEGAPIRYLVNTSVDAQRLGCNEQLARAGQAFTTGVLGWAAPTIAHENALLQLLATPGQSYPAVAIPSEIFTWPEKHLYLNGQGVSFIWTPAAHTNGDLMVLFRHSDVVVAGDVFDDTSFPVIDVAHGGSVQGEITALTRLLNEMTFSSEPKMQWPGGTLIIPGRGQLCNQIDVLNYRDMVSTIRDRVQDLVDKGQSLAQVQASQPARGYVTRYGTSSGSWTTEDFIAAVYQSLSASRAGALK